MKESSVNHPENSQFLIFRAHYVAICERNFCAAALLHVFESFHNYRLALQPMARRNNNLSEGKSKPRSQDETLWQHHSQTDLENYILGIYKRDKIIEAIKYLDKKGFIETGSNPLHPFDRTTHYLFHPKAVQSAIRFNEKETETAQSRKNDNAANKGANGQNAPKTPDQAAQCRKLDNPSSENRQSLTNTNMKDNKLSKDNLSSIVVGEENFANDESKKVADPKSENDKAENKPPTPSNDPKGEIARDDAQKTPQAAANDEKTAIDEVIDPVLLMNHHEELVFWATVANAPKKKRMNRPSEKQKKSIKEIFVAWSKIMNARAGTKLTIERARNIFEALLSYQAEEIVRSCYGLLLSPHYLGVNDRNEVYADIALICRDYGERIEKFLVKVAEFEEKGGKIETLNLKGELAKIKAKTPAEIRKEKEKINNEQNKSDNRTTGKESIIEREARNKNRIADSLEHFGFGTNRNDAERDPNDQE